VRVRSAVLAPRFGPLLLVVCISVSTARGQGPAPETAPPLFPGGGLISYNSIFTTRSLMPQSASIPSTARPTFAHEGDFNFTWGFYRNFDLTILVPIVTNHFDVLSAPTVGGTGFGDAMMLVKYRFYPSIGVIHREGQRKRPLPSVPSFRQDEPTCEAATEAFCLPVCSPARVPLTSSSEPIGPTQDSSTSGALAPMKISRPSSARREHRRLA